MYGPEAIARRRCTARRKDGEHCRAWSLWDDPRQLCMAHAGRHHTGPMKPILMQTMQERLAKYARQRTHYRPCTCEAYAWPHRPGSGLCRWPDPPLYRSLTPAGTHDWPRLRGSLVCRHSENAGWAWIVARQLAAGWIGDT